MAKQSSVQITVKVDGDGVNARFEPVALVNAAAPGAGPVEVALAGGVAQLNLPTGAKGLIISPGSSPPAQLFLGNSGFELDVTVSHFVVPKATDSGLGYFYVLLTAVGPGTIMVQWT